MKTTMREQKRMMRQVRKKQRRQRAKIKREKRKICYDYIFAGIFFFFGTVSIFGILIAALSPSIINEEWESKSAICSCEHLAPTPEECLSSLKDANNTACAFIEAHDGSSGATPVLMGTIGLALFMWGCFARFMYILHSPYYGPSYGKKDANDQNQRNPDGFGIGTVEAHSMMGVADPEKTFGPGVTITNLPGAGRPLHMPAMGMVPGMNPMLGAAMDPMHKMHAMRAGMMGMQRMGSLGAMGMNGGGMMGGGMMGGGMMGGGMMGGMGGVGAMGGIGGTGGIESTTTTTTTAIGGGMVPGMNPMLGAQAGMMGMQRMGSLGAMGGMGGAF
eukprot:g4101.t1